MYLPGFSVTTTTHNAEGKSVVKTDNPKPRTVVENATQIVYSVPGGSLKDGRVSFADEVDLAAHEANPKAFPAPGGCAVVTIAFLPGTSGPMHRTRSLDAGVVVGGEIELILDSGETKMLRQGDVLLQRGTRHDWRNPSETEPCRMVFFVLPAEIPEGAAES